jgi:UDP-N-acetyl-D-glucosamine dehydrogenase
VALDLESVSLTTETLAAADCVVVITNHKTVDYNLVIEDASLIVDTCNACNEAGRAGSQVTNKIIRLGAPIPE